MSPRIIYILGSLCVCAWFVYDGLIGAEFFDAATKERKPSADSRMYHK